MRADDSELNTTTSYLVDTCSFPPPLASKGGEYDLSSLTGTWIFAVARR